MVHGVSPIVERLELADRVEGHIKLLIDFSMDSLN
jgi:hypothetical protein